MTFHFAYPNVLPRQEIFIGCGRYTVFAPDIIPSTKYTEVQGAPNTPNRNSLKRAVQLLASDSYDSVKALFHTQDQQNQKYQGDSLDLAWFLAHILRTRNLRHQAETDTWCTGVLHVDGSGPHLLDVDPDGFFLKLQAFLDPTNNDLLFIAPLANLEPRVRQMCRDTGTLIIRLEDNDSSNLKSMTGKTILAVASDELPSLLELLFIPPASGKSGKRKIKTYLLLLLLLGIAGFAVKPFITSGLQDRNPISVPASSPQNTVIVPEPITPPSQPVADPAPPAPQYRAADIIAEIRQGDFTSAQPLLTANLAKDDHDLQQLRQQITHVLPVQGELQYQLSEGKKGSVPFGADTMPPVLNHRDYYRCLIRTNNPPDTFYIYLFQVDSSGSLTTLFPSPQLGTQNPVRPWQWPLTIPDKDDKWIYLDQLSDSSRQQSLETLYLLASPWPADDIETLILQLPDNTENEAFKTYLLSRISLRRQAELPAISITKWSFFHGQ